MGPHELGRLAKKLLTQGMLDHLGNGRDAISVSLMLPDRVTEKSLEVRKSLLKNKFSEKLTDISQEILEVDLSSISPSGQTVQAKIDIDSILEIYQKLNEKNIQIYPNLRRNILD